ncbi:MAG: S41 family peptidase [Clostridia bacterium]|nr:S41 family peptidase [Clostridia bacterium]
MRFENQKKVPLTVFIFVLVAAILLSFMAAFAVTTDAYMKRLAVYQKPVVPGTDTPVNTTDKLSTVVSILKGISYYDIDDEILCKSLMQGYISILGDPYAYYFNEEEFKALTADNNGDSQGIGIGIIQDAENKCIKVISVYDGSPAEKAGLRTGDRIVKIGIGASAEPINEMSYEAAVKRLQGPAGTTAEFTVARGDDLSEILEFSVPREHFTAQSVSGRVSELTKDGKKIGIIKITGFDMTTPPQFCKAMDNLIAEGCEYYVFDVRYNPGGDLASITAVLSYLLRSGDVVIKTKDRSGNEEITYVKEVKYAETSAYSACSVTQNDIGKYRDRVFGKSAVLVNGNTASAAELFTSSLKDYGVSVIVGTKTYGKGSMQSIINLAYYGYTGAIKCTTKKYFPPVSEGYDGIGIIPDVVVELDEKLKDKSIYDVSDSEDNQLGAAINAFK